MELEDRNTLVPISFPHSLVHPLFTRSPPEAAGQSGLTNPKEERICVFGFHCCSRIPEVTKEEKWLRGWWFQSVVSWFHGIQAWGQAEISSWKSMVGKSVHVVKGGEEGRGGGEKAGISSLFLLCAYFLQPSREHAYFLQPSATS